jgi:hypothetical protein
MGQAGSFEKGLEQFGVRHGDYALLVYGRSAMLANIRQLSINIAGFLSEELVIFDPRAATRPLKFIDILAISVDSCGSLPNNAFAASSAAGTPLFLRRAQH